MKNICTKIYSQQELDNKLEALEEQFNQRRIEELIKNKLEIEEEIELRKSLLRPAKAIKMQELRDKYAPERLKQLESANKKLSNQNHINDLMQAPVNERIKQMLEKESSEDIKPPFIVGKLRELFFPKRRK